MNASQNINTAIIGLGSMGMGIAINAMKSGIVLKGFDIDKSSRDRFSRAGGIASESASHAASEVDLLVLMVVNAEQAEDVLFGSGDAASSMPKGGTIMLCSTIAPSEARDLGQKAVDMGLHFLDTPVSGGKVGADQGALTVMASGPPAAFDVAGPLLDAISKKVYRLGDAPGLGSTYKVVHQLAAGVHLVAAAELMTLGVNAGCDMDQLFEIVSNSAGSSWMYNDRVPRMLEGDFEPRSMVDIFIKDLGLVLQTGLESGAHLPLSAAAHQMMVSASSLGYGKLDDSAVVKAYEGLTGRTVESQK